MRRTLGGWEGEVKGNWGGGKREGQEPRVWTEADGSAGRAEREGRRDVGEIAGRLRGGHESLAGGEDSVESRRDRSWDLEESWGKDEEAGEGGVSEGEVRMLVIDNWRGRLDTS